MGSKYREYSESKSIFFVLDMEPEATGSKHFKEPDTMDTAILVESQNTNRTGSIKFTNWYLEQRNLL